MKKRILSIVAIAALSISSLSAQKSIRLGYIDMEYILENVPEYQQASRQLDNRVQEWKAEAEAKMQKVEDMKTRLDNERALLTKELIEEREGEIAYMEQQAREYQQNRFGPNGDYMIQKKQLVRPIQDQVFTAVQQIAENRNLDFVFDRTADIGMIYADQQYDVSETVLRTIKRTANREQLENRDEIKKFEQEENRTVEQDKEITEREELVEQRKTEREAFIEERKRERDSLKAARQKEFEDRRAKILAERERKRDSIINAREQKNDTIN
ncbi:OmpH family outer membrane protein [Christiangramia sp. SM2212]|uniref:OmpH family outer membrane protein n=1 Tax=Christiangramia sediminicola TaxID=3073267 RepID=A0ABU1EM20_9FLAO|nr:OmpH family outer membrane protein [Christiangramia sp. SM2212]MDR5589407.1 OmpH family outer membrane protein [Christiangramia sp. SM2212]